ncbi:MAG: hypothetical protein CMH31_06435 [Micavibrio sp.]|nr:hypothetical protein [Micavibrio sp.]
MPTSLINYGIAFIAICGYASLGVLAKRSSLDVPPFAFIGVTMVFLAGFAITASLLTEKTFSISSLTGQSWIWMIGFAVINFIAFSLYLNAIGKMPVVEYQIIAVITPIIGGILGYLILSEALSPRYFIGIAITALGLYIALKK